MPEKTRVPWAQSRCCLSFYRSPLLWASGPDASNWIRRSVWRIHYFHIARDAPCPATFCVNVVLNFSWLLQPRLTIFLSFFFCVFGGRGGKHGSLWATSRELTFLRPIAVKRGRRHAIWITHFLRTVPDLVKTSFLSTRALGTSISNFLPLDKLRAYQLTLAFTVPLSGWCC